MKTKKSFKTLALGIIGALVLTAIVVIIGMTITACGSGTSKTNAPTKKVTDANGSVKVLPTVGMKGETAPVDTTHDARTPASFHPFTPDNKPVLTWFSLVDAVNSADATWYRNAVNDRAKETGFNWADIQKWAGDPQMKGVYPLTIQVFGGGFTNTQAREIAAGLVGHNLADKLPIVRHSAGVLINTRSIGDKQVGDFLDLRSMVRVSLSPIVYNKKGEVIGVRTDSGIFADCLNIWRLGRVVKHHAKTPGKTPPKHKKHKHLKPKDWRLDPWPQGNALIGGGHNKTNGPGQYDPPGSMTPPPNHPYTPPPTPKPVWTPTPGATATPTAEPTPLPTPTPENTNPPVGPGPTPPGTFN